MLEKAIVTRDVQFLELLVAVTANAAASLADHLFRFTLLETDGAALRVIPADRSPDSGALFRKIFCDMIGPAMGREMACGVLLLTGL